MSVCAFLLIPFLRKVRHGIFGRYNMFGRLSTVQFSKISKSGKKIIWFHVASAGEFEQALPIMTALKKKYDNIFILVTFFSPSGYYFYQKKQFDFIDFAEYSPVDSILSMVRFLNVVRPDVLILSKYDIWPNMIWLSYFTRVKVIMINGSLQKLSKRFTSVVKYFFGSVYSCFHFIGTITEADADRFKEAISNKEIINCVGDTKYDRVVNRKKAQKLDFCVDKLLREHVMIAASIWEEDEEYLLPVVEKLFEKYPNSFSLIVVHHEPNDRRLSKWEEFLDRISVKSIRLSNLKGAKVDSIPVLLVDRIGMLAELYKISDFAYVGGGFSRGGVHNILEPAIYGNPTVFGTKFHNSYEASLFIEEGISRYVSTSDEILEYALKLFNDRIYLEEMGAKHINRVNDLCGATHRYLEHIGGVLDSAGNV
jgi:3-deoxy-D-manno-octulosonic-acid transferase